MLSKHVMQHLRRVLNGLTRHNVLFGLPKIDEGESADVGDCLNLFHKFLVGVEGQTAVVGVWFVVLLCDFDMMQVRCEMNRFQCSIFSVLAFMRRSDQHWPMLEFCLTTLWQ